MAISWSDELKTEIVVIDEQHQILFETINKLDELKENKVVFWEILIELQNYVVKHFITEEGFMKAFHYPNFSYHKASHDKFVSDYKKFLERVSLVDDIMILGSELVDFLEEWLVRHYTEEDVKMASYLKSHIKKSLQD